MLYMKFVKRVTLFFCISEMMPVHWTYCDNHFMMYVKSNHYALYFKHMQWYMPIISQLEGKRKKKGRKGKGKKKFTFRLCHRHFSLGFFVSKLASGGISSRSHFPFLRVPHFSLCCRKWDVRGWSCPRFQASS